jgi:hypothetical protein
MPSKSLLIAIAAFAVTTTGAQAFVGDKYFTQSGLSSEQIQAFTQARELRQNGDKEAARDLLLNAGVTADTMDSLREAAHASHDAIHAAVLAGDYAAFKEAVAGTPLYDIITSEADFALFKEAHDLKRNGSFAEAKSIFNDLGVPSHQTGKHIKKHYNRFLELSDEQKDALRAARQSNDKEAVDAILAEAGIVAPLRKEVKEMRNQWR